MTTILLTIDSDGVSVLANDDRDTFFADRLMKDEALGEIASWLYADKPQYGRTPQSLMQENRLRVERAKAQDDSLPF